MQQIRTNKTKRTVPRVDRFRYKCDYCEFETLFPEDLPYHYAGYHRIELTDDDGEPLFDIDE